MRFAFVTVLLFSQLSFADTYINVCDRGLIGDLIAEQLNAQDCSVVLDWKMKVTKSLFFEGKRIASIPKNAFEGFPALEILSLSHNPIETIPTEALKNLTLLQELQLHDCYIDSVSTDAFSGLISLKSLALDNNQISSISANAFAGLSSLEDLAIYSNPIEAFSKSEVGLLKSVRIYNGSIIVKE